MAIKVKCMNDKCNNYNQELDERVETCSLCNKSVTRFETNVNSKLQLIAVIVALAAPIIFMFGFYPWYWAGLAMSPASVVVALISRSKPAIITSILSVLANIGLFIFYFFT